LTVDLDRFSDDAPDDDAPGDATVCVVATRPDTFERCRAGFYPSPASYDRSRRGFGYMALYRTAPVSAVTHYAPVVGRHAESRDEDGTMSESDWRDCIDPFVDDDEVIVLEFDDLVPLEEPVTDDPGSNGVRGAWYCEIDDLRDSATVSELADAAETERD